MVLVKECEQPIKESNSREGSVWLENLLGELTDNFDSIRVPVKQADRRAGPYPYYGASGIVDSIDDYLFDGEYLLIAEDGENLRTRNTPIAFLANGKFWVNNHAHIVRGNHKANTRYLMYALSALDISGYLTGSTMPKLTQGNMNRIRVLAPPLPEQCAIAHILGTLDDKIELNRRMNETLEAIARELFKSWFVDFDPVRAKMEGRYTGLPKHIADLFPERLVDSELGEIPEGWEISTIGEEVAVVGGSTPSTKDRSLWDGEINWATPKDLSTLSAPVLLETARQISEAGLGKIGSGLLPQGVVLLSSRAPIGYLAIAEIPVAVNQGFIAMRCESRLSNIFVWLWTQANMDTILQNANGSTFQEISKRNFRPLNITIPKPEILSVFDKRVRLLYKRIVKNQRESRHSCRPTRCATAEARVGGNPPP